MNNYIDGYVFSIAIEHLEEYKSIAEKVADIWKEHGAIAYNEFVGGDVTFEGTRSFTEMLDTKKDEVIIFGFIVFESETSREVVHQKVTDDHRMIALVEPLTIPEKLIFDASKMIYGGFQSIVN